MLRDEGGQSVALYVLHCDSEFVEEPMPFQLRAAGSLLFSPNKAMTLFFLLPQRVTGDSEAAIQRASGLLLAAIQSFVNGAPVR